MKQVRTPILLAAIVIGSVARIAIAADEPMPKLAGDYGPTLLQLVGALILVVGIIYASVWLMKRYSTGKIAGGGNLISIVERRHLTPKQAIYLVKVGEKHLLIGASESGLSKLSDIEIPEIRQAPQAKGNATSISKFSQILRQAKSSVMPLLSAKEKSVGV